MHLVDPTDFDILEILTEGRNVPGNLAIRLDVEPGYIRTELPKLAKNGLVERIGPAERSGLYEITDRGRAALELREQYDSETDFEAVLDRHLSD